MYRPKRPKSWDAKVRLKRPANPQGKSVAVIPRGHFCYGETRMAEPGERTASGEEIVQWVILCPYFAPQRQHPSDRDGYCALLSIGDWMDGRASMLFDQVKECGYRMREEAPPKRFAIRRARETRQLGNLPRRKPVRRRELGGWQEYEHPLPWLW